MSDAPSVAIFTMKRHDTMPLMRLAVTNATTGLPFDFSGASVVRFYMYSKNGDPKVQAAATMEGGPTSGILQYAWVGGDTDEAGEFSGEFEVDYGGGKKITMPNTGVLTIRILEDLNNA